MSQENVEVIRGTRIPIPRLSERASQRRSLDQRLFVLWPVVGDVSVGAASQAEGRGFDPFVRFNCPPVE